MSENNSIVKILMVIILGLIIVGALAFYIIKPIMIKKELPKPVAINTQDQPTTGSVNAKVHFVVFEDLKCSNCARFNRTLMPYIQKQFIDTGVAKYTMINLAFIEGSLPAANAAHCVYMQNNELFFAYTDYIFHHQPPENENWATIPALMNFASQIKGIDMDRLSQCLVKSPYDQFIQQNLAQAKQIMKDRGVATPTLYINGILVDPLTKSQINKVVDAVK